MREFDFLATWEDSWQVLNSILSDGRFTVSPSKWYATPQAEVYHELTPALKEFLHSRRQLYIWSTLYTKGATAFSYHNSGPHAGTYSIDARRGGPALELVLPACFTRDNKTYLNFGKLSYRNEFLDPETGQWQRPSAELRAGFVEVVRRMKAYLIPEGKTWIGKDAQLMVRSGAAELYIQTRPPEPGSLLH